MRTRKNFIATRLNDAEMHHFLVLLEQSGCSRYELLRRLIMGAELKKIPDTDLRELSRSIDRIGNNINQLTHLANARGYVQDSSNFPPTPIHLSRFSSFTFLVRWSNKY